MYDIYKLKQLKWNYNLLKYSSIIIKDSLKYVNCQYKLKLF